MGGGRPVGLRLRNSHRRARRPSLAPLTAPRPARLLRRPGPRPGPGHPGLGFVEAGLTAALALAGVPAASAVVATLAYRLVSYWLPCPSASPPTPPTAARSPPAPHDPRVTYVGHATVLIELAGTR